MTGDAGNSTCSRAFTPPDAHDAADYVAALRRLRSESGLTFREIGGRARQHGDTLPHSTLASALRRQSLPRRDLVDAFVRACGGTTEDVSSWLARHDQLSSDNASPPKSEPTPCEPSAAENHRPTQRVAGTDPVTPAPLVVPKTLRLPRPVFAIIGIAVISWLGLFLAFGEHLVRPSNVHWFTIGTQYGTCLDITGVDHLGDPVVQEAPCRSGRHIGQRFARVDRDDAQKLKVYNPNTSGSTWCIDTGEHGQLRLSACVNSSRTQLFHLQPTPNGGTRIRPAHGQQCFGMAPRPNHQSRHVQLGNCARGPDQEFQLRPA